MQPCLVRRDTVEKAGAYRTDLAPSEDREMLYRLLRQARSVRHTPDTLMLYRIHPENQISGQNDAKRLVDLSKLIGLFEAELGRRPELGSREWRKFLRHKSLVAAALKGSEPACAKDLLADAAWGGRMSAPLYYFMQTRLFGRIQGKLRRTLFDSAYPKAYGGAPVRPNQLQKILDLGYRLAG